MSFKMSSVRNNVLSYEAEELPLCEREDFHTNILIRHRHQVHLWLCNTNRLRLSPSPAVNLSVKFPNNILDWEFNGQQSCRRPAGDRTEGKTHLIIQPQSVTVCQVQQSQVITRDEVLQVTFTSPVHSPETPPPLLPSFSTFWAWKPQTCLWVVL